MFHLSPGPTSPTAYGRPDTAERTVGTRPDVAAKHQPDGQTRAESTLKGNGTVSAASGGRLTLQIVPIKRKWTFGQA